MTTSTKRKAIRKPSGIKREFLPESAKFATIDDTEYVLIPVADFGEWYEDIEDGAVVAYARQNPEPLIPAEKVHADLKRRPKGGSK